MTLTRPYYIGPDGMPYGRATAGFNGNAATVWVEPTQLQLSTDDSSFTPYTNGCGYLGSTEMITDPRAVASIRANGTPDCGVTFIGPGTFNTAPADRPPR